MALEADVRYRIDRTLENKGWILNPDDPLRNVYFESSLPQGYSKKLGRKRPDYTLLYKEHIDDSYIPLGVIEAKKPGSDLDKALAQGTQYAQKLNAPLVFAINGTFCKTRYVQNSKTLLLNGQEVKELLRVKEVLGYLTEKSNELYTIPKEVIKSREEMISLFGDLNDVLRGEGLRAGIERFSEFANILFLKLLSEHNKSSIWNDIKKQQSKTRIEYINKIVLANITKHYGGDVFSPLLIKKPSTLDDIIERLDPLYLTPVDEDIKGGAFEYFLEKTTSTQNDLGEYFTPRHIIKAVVNLANPKFGETVYDPFCGTGGFLTGAFNYIRESLENNKEALKFLKKKSIFGREITTTSRIAKMNMILHGDGHSGVSQCDSLGNPVKEEYHVVMTNIPFSQKIVKKGKDGKVVNDVTEKYYDSLGRNSGDAVCLLHCFKSLKPGGRMAIIVPEGFLFRRELKPVRQFLLDHANLHSVVSLPQGCFLPYTGVKTDVLYFTEAEQVSTQKYWFFKVENDGFTLDSHRRKIEEDNDIDKVNASSIREQHIPQDEVHVLQKIGFRQVQMSDIKDDDYNLLARYSIQHEVISQYDVVKIGDICEVVRGGSPRPISKYLTDKPNGLNWIKIGDTQGIGKYITSVKERIKPEGLSKTRMVQEGDLLLSNSMSFGKSYIMKTTGCIHDGWLLLRPKIGDVTIDYLYYLLSSHKIYQRFSELASGTTVKNLNINIVRKAEIPLPPIQKQYEIIAELDCYQSIIEDAKSILSKYKPFFKICQTWETVTFSNSQLFSVISGGTPNTEKREYWEGEFHWISLVDLPTKNIITEIRKTQRTITQEGLENSSAKILPINTIIISSRATIGRVGINKIPLATNQGFKSLIINDFSIINPKYVAYFIAIFLKDEMESMASGSTFKEISKTAFSKLEMQLPNITIQNEIVKFLEYEQSMIENQENIVIYFEKKIQDRLKTLWELE